MRNAIESLVKALDSEVGGVVVVRCPDLGLREWLVEQVESLVPYSARAFRVTDVEAALREPDRLVLLIPPNERDAVLDLDASQDRTLEIPSRRPALRRRRLGLRHRFALRRRASRNKSRPGRTQPIVLFLLRGGDGERALVSEAPSLQSWVSGRDPDPEALAEIDIENEREAFGAKHHVTPEVWLERWRSGALPKTGANFRTAFDASLIQIEEER